MVSHLTVGHQQGLAKPSFGSLLIAQFAFDYRGSIGPQAVSQVFIGVS